MTLRVATDYVGEIERLRAEVARLEEERASMLTGMRAAAEYNASSPARLRAALANTMENRAAVLNGWEDDNADGVLAFLRVRAGIE